MAKNVQQVIGASINGTDITDLFTKSGFSRRRGQFDIPDATESASGKSYLLELGNRLPNTATFSFNNSTQILDQIEKIFEIGTGLQIVVGPQVGSNDTTEITINNFARVGVIEKDESGPIKVTIQGDFLEANEKDLNLL